MKKSLLAAFLALTISLPGRADFKIAVVDTGKAFDAYYKTKDVATKIAAREAKYKKEVDELQGEYQRAGQEAQDLADSAKNPALPIETRKEKDIELTHKVEDLKAMEKELSEMTSQRGTEIRDELKRSHQEINEGILKVIADYARPLGYDLILDKTYDSTAAQASRTPFYTGKVVDITPEIIARLNASAPSS